MLCSVIVRAYGDEPVKMEAVALAPKSAEVRRPNGSGITVCLSTAIVFEFDEARYRELLAVFMGGDPFRLSRLWQITPRFAS